MFKNNFPLGLSQLLNSPNISGPTSNLFIYMRVKLILGSLRNSSNDYSPQYCGISLAMRVFPFSYLIFSRRTYNNSVRVKTIIYKLIIKCLKRLLKIIPSSIGSYSSSTFLINQFQKANSPHLNQFTI